MRYVGGKSRLARQIEQLVSNVRGTRQTYIEPFVGGGAVFSRVAPTFTVAWAGDISPDLILMWQAIADGWTPPTSINAEQYLALREAEPSALRGFVGFGCSFGGKWFGGRAKGGFNADGSERNHAAESARAALRVGRAFRTGFVVCRDYREWAPDSDTVIYADPPYANTQSYAVGTFNSEEFWIKAEEWADAGAQVLVSEYEAPANWVPVLKTAHRESLRHGKSGRPQTTECVFALGSRI